MLYIATLGYDEKFIVRFLMRYGISRNDSFVLVVAKDFEKNEKARNAYQNLRSLLSTLVDPKNIHTLSLDPHENPISNIKKIVRTLNKIPHEEIKACLSGGMRILIILVILALSLLKNKIITIDVDFEDLTGYQTIQYNALTIPKNERWINVLQHIKRGIKRIRQLATKTGLSPATISREISNMEQYNLIRRSDGIEITPIGNAYLLLHTDQE